jgi:hypothetical protein
MPAPVPVISGFNAADGITPSLLNQANDFDQGVAQLVGGLSNNAMKVLSGCPGLYRFQFQRSDASATGLSEFINLQPPP